MSRQSDFVRAMERALGIGVLVQSVEPGPPVRITASLMLDSRSGEVSGVGESEAEAWQDLGRAAMAWRNEDQQNIRIYGGG
jgi:hypothetical protein